MEYSIELKETWVCLEIIQRQTEDKELCFQVPPDGVVTTNDIFGPEHAGMGYIECGKIKNEKIEDGRYRFEFNVSILFKVEEENQ